MKLITQILLMMFSGIVTASQQVGLETLSQLQWHNRVILIWDKDGASHQKILSDYEEGINERHILWFVFTDEALLTNFTGNVDDKFSGKVTRRYTGGNDNAEQTVILIGKDGGVKSREAVLDLDDLFTLIDSMPMRQSEMRQRAI